LRFSKYSLDKEKDVIPASHDEIIVAIKLASKHRDSIVSNISYASQISGEDLSQYRESIKNAEF
jgi:hypothetical protein